MNNKITPQYIKKRITVVGSGYVGLSIGVLLAQSNKVTILDINKERVDNINNKKSTIFDPLISDYLVNKNLMISATESIKDAYLDAEIIIIATPTNYDELTNNFDTSSVDAVVNDASILNKSALIVIKSTIPIGHTQHLVKINKNKNIIFSPEFLREGKALEDNLNPSRLIIGGDKYSSKIFEDAMNNDIASSQVKTFYMSPDEAETVKLFANTYLAMRVSFFNELDSFSINHNLDSKNLVDGISSDPRIGSYYNNPSFGYGGYCLPKDTKQLLSSFNETPEALITAVVESNQIRKEFISKLILKKETRTIGFYRIVMKTDSDNYRSSSIIDVIEAVAKSNKNVLVFEPNLNSSNNPLKECTFINDIHEFKNKSDLIVANRITIDLHDVMHKVFTRDIYNEN